MVILSIFFTFLASAENFTGLTRLVIYAYATHTVRYEIGQLFACPMGAGEMGKLRESGQQLEVPTFMYAGALFNLEQR